MTEAELLLLADEIEATVRAEVAQVLGSLKTQVAEMSAILGTLSADLAALKTRIEEVAKEPRVVLRPEFVVPQAQAPAVHVAPLLSLPPRKPVNRTVTKQPNGNFKIEETE